MNAAPLQLGNYHFTQIHIEAQPNSKPEDFARVDWSVNANAFPRNKGNLREWFVFVLLEIKAKEGSFPAYLGKVEVAGIFTVADGWQEDQIEKLVFVNGGGILYAAIREMVCLITGRSIYGSLTIPSYSFIDMHKEWKVTMEKIQKEQAEAAPQSPPPVAEKTNA